jgi:hypothetical protein
MLWVLFSEVYEQLLAQFLNSLNRALFMTATFPLSVEALQNSVIICSTIVKARNTWSVTLLFTFLVCTDWPEIWLASQRHINLMRGSLFQIIIFIALTVSWEERRNCRCSEKRRSPYLTTDPPPLVSIAATRFCLPTGSSKVLLATVYMSPGHVWNDANLTEL